MLTHSDKLLLIHLPFGDKCKTAFILVKATPHKDRLEALHVIRQCFTKSMIWIETQVPLGYACRFSFILHKISLTYASVSPNL